MGQLDGKTAVITGAGSGMGREATRLFVREGARVLAADISEREKETAAELGDAVVPFHCDVSLESDVETMFQAALAEFGALSAVLNVAGVGGAQPLAEITMAEYDRIMDVDLRGVLLGTKHAIRAMLPTGGGSIINWSSTGSINASQRQVSAYSAAKAGVNAFTKAAAVEYGPKGIRANAICPGFIVTELSAEAVERFPQLVASSPMRRAGRPEEVAELALFLASDRASFINGAIIPIDGGTTASLP
ncbi:MULTISPECIES: SDR family NAD(P)-dependent oxidoreductase [unclassified Pseudofrankia]|uniref:SDR family NAD(P)-dependent oxidoreductase n=1 Tax=unclassified Pseudofrankia TaxID=2994372 RepID=UPI0008DB2566|nr:MULTISPECIES: SDR family NAD(P)-dependent oxidoreductase [unclassified Pseudofrankia]MDT3446286.1 SDR family NAD(P)-dependent oxidoreductase [Pseudofrankia sp. BMG5.37]OHV63092.1 short-chain dehydrogenase [Pseudofrankia sp. BMG5.36]